MNHGRANRLLLTLFKIFLTAPSRFFSSPEAIGNGEIHPPVPILPDQVGYGSDTFKQCSRKSGMRAGLVCRRMFGVLCYGKSSVDG